MTRDHFERRLFGTLRWVSVGGFVLITAFPLLYMLALSLRPIPSLLQNPGNPIPSLEELFADNYLRVLRPVAEGGVGLIGYMRNSIILSVTTVIIVILLGLLGAYAATRLRFRGHGLVNVSIIAVYLFPPVLLAVPMFVVFSRLGLRPSLGAVVISYVAYTLPLSLFLLRNYLESLPIDFDDAARVDGASRLQVIRLITAPLSAPAIAAVGLYVFMVTWDEFLFALLILVEDRDLWTVTLAIQRLRELEGGSEAILMAGCVVVALPVVVAFFVAERFLVEGLTTGGVKE